MMKKVYAGPLPEESNEAIMSGVYAGPFVPSGPLKGMLLNSAPDKPDGKARCRCGAEVRGKFCSECGAPLDNQNMQYPNNRTIDA